MSIKTLNNMAPPLDFSFKNLATLTGKLLQLVPINSKYYYLLVTLVLERTMLEVFMFASDYDSHRN